MTYPKSLQNLITELESLPGIGPKMAGRIALSLFKYPSQSEIIRESLSGITHLKKCIKCNSISDEEVCSVCSDNTRESNKIMVVEDYFDSVVIENTGSFKGYYYIIEGLISPLNNIMPENLRIKGLIDRLKELISKSSSLEVIFALNPSLEGESTMLFIEREIGKNSAVSYSRLAMGVPRGSDIDYIDTDTLSSAIESRKQFN